MISEYAADYLRLSLVSGVGAHTARQLIEACGSVSAVWQQPEKTWQDIEGVGPKLVQALSAALTKLGQQKLHDIINQCENNNIHIICQDDDVWPESLKACADAPLVLYAYGQVSCLKTQKILGMVGARKASSEGKLIARRWSAFCSKQGVCIVSGMAPGIDSAAHGGSLDADSAGIAVLGYGLKAGSAQQLKQIEALAVLGCVVSEYSPETVARAGYFPQRNRLIAGMSQALLVVEGGLKSGSLITARYALSYGCEVFAVPGSVLNDVHEGCHQLIKDGAILANHAEDILQHLGWNKSENKALAYQPTSETESNLIGFLGHEILHVDTLAEYCCLTVPELSTILLRLELGGIIEKLPGSRYTLC